MNLYCSHEFMDGWITNKGRVGDPAVSAFVESIVLLSTLEIGGLGEAALFFATP